MQVDVLRAIGIGIEIGNNPLGVERRMHQHSGQPLQFAPLFMRRIVIQAGGRPRLIDQIAAFITDNQETAGSRTVKGLRCA